VGEAKTDPDIRVYEKPLIYDIAFGYRDFRREADLLRDWCRRASGPERPQSVLELAAGPADHALEFAARGRRAAALDLSPAMCDFARRKAAARGVALDVHCADMVDFSLGARFDLALLMISSAAHIYTLDAFVRHLRSVARHLSPRGCYILEMPHPADILAHAHPTRTGSHWTMERDGIEVETRWGSAEDPYDPIAQVVEARVELRVRTGGREELLVERCRMREWTAGELEAAVKLSGAFEIAEQHGEFALDAPFDATERSWRMITVLRALA
jgi:SAM-dependent methyltransferase